MLPIALLSQNRAINNGTPNPLPVLKSTGNPTLDKQTYEQELKDWKQLESIRNKEFNNSNTPVTNSVKEDEFIQKKLARKEGLGKREESANESNTFFRQTTIIDLPSFPKYVSTGNTTLDENNYQENKSKWINEHPELYSNYLLELKKQNPSNLQRFEHKNSSK